MSNLQNIEVFWGEDRTWTLYARDASNNPLDITTMTLDFRIGWPPVDTDQRASVADLTGTVINGAAGSYSVSWEPMTTPGVGNHHFQTVATDTGRLGFVNNADGPITWTNNAGGVITWISNNAGNVEVVTTGRLKVRRFIQ